MTGSSSDIFFSQVAIPVYVRAMINFKDGQGKVDITVGPKQTLGKTVSLIKLRHHAINFIRITQVIIS